MSKRHDPETGFIYFSRRYYAPETGRWITPDPLGFADGPNMYAYVKSNPLTKFDLYGLFIEDEAIRDGYSAKALAAMAYGFGEALVMGAHDFICMLHPAERQAEIFETGTLEESNQAFLDAYMATSALVHQAASS